MKITALLVCLTGAAIGAWAGNVAIEGGAASFVVGTTVPGISVKGKSTSLQGRAVVQNKDGALHIESIDAVIPVKSLATGMAMRDEHMRRYIFTKADGQTPDLHFEAASTDCAAQSGKHGEYLCQLSGSLSIRGVAKPFTIPLKVREENSGFHAAGESIVKLSSYGIEQPSQFGVKTSDEIQLRLDFTGKEGRAELAAGGSR